MKELPFGAKSIINVICLKTLSTWFSFVLLLRDQRQLLFIASGQTASSFHHGMIKRLTSLSLRSLAFHSQLVQSSLTLKNVTFHLCNENFPTSDCLGKVFVGKVLNLAEHLTHSQGHFPCFLV